MMRRFLDEQGKPWDVIVGRESWGTLVALFVPAGIGREDVVRQTGLDAASPDVAQTELDTLDDDALAELFARSTPKES